MELWAMGTGVPLKDDDIRAEGGFLSKELMTARNIKKKKAEARVVQITDTKSGKLVARG